MEEKEEEGDEEEGEGAARCVVPIEREQATAMRATLGIHRPISSSQRWMTDMNPTIAQTKNKRASLSH